jgi:hypothetical protein
LKEMGVLIAHAFHEPGKLDSLFRPSVEETLERSTKDPSEWDYDEWWNTTG